MARTEFDIRAERIAAGNRKREAEHNHQKREELYKLAGKPSVEIDCFMRDETNKAWLIEIGVGRKAWFPKANTILYRGGGSLGSCDKLELPEWLAKQRGLIK